LIRDCLNQYVSDYDVVGEENDDKPTAVMVKISEKVIEFIGCRSEDNIMSRSDVFDTVLKYVSDNRLQTDEKENNNIRCDEKLELLFQRKKLTSAKLTKLLEKVRLKLIDRRMYVIHTVVITNFFLNLI
jgi:chromatin remodeling complex protein RSC6